MRLLAMPSLALVPLAFAAAAPEAIPFDGSCSAGDPGCHKGPDPDEPVNMLQFKSKVSSLDAVVATDAQQDKDGKQRPTELLGTKEEHIKYIAGVPVHNYHMAHLGGMNPSLLELEATKTWTIMLPDNSTDDDEKAFCEGMPGSSKCNLRGHPSEGGLGFVAVNATEKELEKILKNHPGASFVEPDMEVNAIPEIKAIPWVPPVPWGLDRIDSASGLDGKYSAGGNGGAGVHVYVLDTGVRITHDEFEGRAIPTLESVYQLGDEGPWECGKRKVLKHYGDIVLPDEHCAMDYDGHGTHCAGTVAGKTSGVAKAATIHAVKVLNPSGHTSYIAAAIDWIEANGRKPAVMSMSLGGPGTSSVYQKAITSAVNAGIPVVVAAGNDNDDACNYRPAFVPAAITVGSTDGKDRRSSFSNYGSCVDLFAPGTDIRSAGYEKDSDFRTISGTSMACPHVAGAMALLLGQNYTGSDATRELLDTATKNEVWDVEGKGDTKNSPNKLLYIAGPCPGPLDPPSYDHSCICGAGTDKIAVECKKPALVSSAAFGPDGKSPLKVSSPCWQCGKRCPHAWEPNSNDSACTCDMFSIKVASKCKKVDSTGKERVTEDDCWHCATPCPGPENPFPFSDCACGEGKQKVKTTCNPDHVGLVSAGALPPSLEYDCWYCKGEKLDPQETTATTTTTTASCRRRSCRTR